MQHLLLEQNYPNPFSPTTVVMYSVPPTAGRDLVSNSVRDGQLPVVSDAKLVVFDILDREVAALIVALEEAGYKSVQWDASGVASGVYFYRLQAGDFVQTRKLLVLR
jgi:hypothetical protein